MYVPQYCWKPNYLPVLSREQIETIAEGYLADFQPEALKEPMPVDVDGFLEMYLGVTPDYQYLSHNMIYLGMTVFQDTNRIPVFDPTTNRAVYFSAKANTVIFDTRLVEEENQEHRYRFTAGHEGGHVIFHRAYFQYLDRLRRILGIDDDSFIKCHRTDLARKKGRKLETNSDWLEWQANQFSSSFLMPRSTVNIILENHELNALGLFAVICEMESTFNVSYEAAKNRLSGMGVLRKVAELSVSSSRS